MADLLREPPGPILRFFLRAPRLLYSLGLGWLLGRRFVQVVHIGRRSGVERRTVLEVVCHDGDGLVVAAAWGPASDWFRNAVAHPSARLSTGRLKEVPATARVLDESEAVDVFGDYRQRHPKSAEALSRAVGLPIDDVERMAATVPAVRFTFGRDDEALS